MIGKVRFGDGLLSRKNTVFLKLNQANSYLTTKNVKKQAFTMHTLSAYFVQGAVLRRSNGEYKTILNVVPVSRVTIIPIPVATTRTNTKTPW